MTQLSSQRVWPLNFPSRDWSSRRQAPGPCRATASRTWSVAALSNTHLGQGEGGHRITLPAVIPPQLGDLSQGEEDVKGEGETTTYGRRRLQPPFLTVGEPRTEGECSRLGVLFSVSPDQSQLVIPQHLRGIHSQSPSPRCPSSFVKWCGICVTHTYLLTLLSPH